jgi:hypothetical protein
MESDKMVSASWQRFARHRSAIPTNVVLRSCFFLRALLLEVRSRHLHLLLADHRYQLRFDLF